jgi:hypothetical protein
VLQQTSKREEADIKAEELPLAAAGSSSNLGLFKTLLINSKPQY